MVNFIKSLLSADEEFPVKDIRQWLKEKLGFLFLSGGIINNDEIKCDAPLSEGEIGVILLNKFFAKRDIYSLRKDTTKEKSNRYIFVKEKTSPAVIERFLKFFDR